MIRSMSMEHEQINDKSVALCVRGAKLTGRLLAKAMQEILKDIDGLTNSKSTAAKGKQSVKQLVRQGQGVSNIEINDKNIKSFESSARKYGIDYAVKKDNTETPPKWLVFFKAKDADALTSAFKDFTAKETKKSVAKKPSVLKTLQKFSELIKTQVVDKVKNKSRGGHTR